MYVHILVLCILLTYLNILHILGRQYYFNCSSYGVKAIIY